jgi:uncharacterized protein (DUF1800 family)
MPSNPGDIAHLLRRTGFGAPTGLVTQLSQLTIAEAVDRVLDFSANPADQLNFPADASLQNYAGFLYVRQWWLNRMATVPNPLQEKLTLFWHSHFAVSIGKIGDLNLMVNQNKKLRANCTGDFERLAQIICFDPALLIYLDNQDNYKTAPNENFARELMELFLLGVDQGYTEEDVVQMARAWTGHSVEWISNVGWGNYTFYPDRHDDGSKTLFGITKNWDASATITEMVRGSRSQYCAKFVAKKLWSFFAGPTTVNDAFATQLGADLLAANFNIGAYLRTMFNRAEFYSDAVKNGLVRSPVDWAVSLLRASGVSAFTPAYLDSMLKDVGQGVLEPPNVSGWKINEVWLNETVVWGKEDIAVQIAQSAIKTDFLTSLSALSPSDATSQVLASFGIDRVTPATRSAITTWITAERSAQSPDERFNLIRLVSMTPEFQMA